MLMAHIHLEYSKNLMKMFHTDFVSHVLAASNGATSKTKVMYRALLGYMQMKEYVIF